MSFKPHVIWPQFLDGGHVIDAAWRAAKGGLVGTCPCGGCLRRGEVSRGRH